MTDDTVTFTLDELHIMLNQIRQIEREACANLCERLEAHYEGDELLGVYCADAIRARGEK